MSTSMKQLKKPLLLSKEKAANDESSAYSWSYWRNLAYKVWMAIQDIGTTELVNNTGYVIKFWYNLVDYGPLEYLGHTLQVGANELTDKEKFQDSFSSMPRFVIIKVNGKPQIGFHPVDFVEYEKFVFNLNPEGKLIIHLTARSYGKQFLCFLFFFFIYIDFVFPNYYPFGFDFVVHCLL